MPRTKPALLRRVEADIKTAELRGQRLARIHPYPITAWLNSSQVDKETPLGWGELQAKARLLPATWAANVARGWRTELEAQRATTEPEAS